MDGQMFKESILLDEDKIIADGIYNVDELYAIIEKKYLDEGQIRGVDLPDGSRMYYGVNGWKDLDAEIRVFTHFLRQDWHKYIKKWKAYENRNCQSNDSFNEIDIIENFNRPGDVVTAALDKKPYKRLKKMYINS